MATPTLLEAAGKRAAGTGPARAARRAGTVPGILYGDSRDPEMFTLERKGLELALSRGSLRSRIISLCIDGAAHQSALIRGIQYDPVSDRPIHIDFQRVGATTPVTVQVPVEFTFQDRSPGLRRGGVLNVVRHSVEVRCLARDIPASLQADLTGLQINESVHISAVPLPKGVEPTIKRDFTIATIAVPSGLRGQVASEAAGEAADATTGE